MVLRSAPPPPPPRPLPAFAFSLVFLVRRLWQGIFGCVVLFFVLMPLEKNAWVPAVAYRS